MAAIGGGAIIQKSLERSAFNDLGTALLYGNGTSPFEIGVGPQGPAGTLVDAVTISLLLHLNAGTVTAGTLGADVSNDGVNWTDSGVTPLALTQTDGSVTMISVSKYNAAVKMPARYVRAKIASAASTGAPTVDLSMAG